MPREDPPRNNACELCEADRLTQWFHEDELCWVAECDGCATPMVVWARHGTDPPAADRDHMLARLGEVAAQALGDHWFDEVRRSIPDHWHAHARPAGGFYGW